MDTTTRAWAYRAALVAIAALIAVDVFQGGDAAGWVTWIAGAIGLGAAGLAVANTPTKRDDR